MPNKSKVSVLPKIKTVIKPPKMKRPRHKNICICGKKMKKDYDDCAFCGGGEFYACDCGRMYDSKGREI